MLPSLRDSPCRRDLTSRFPVGFRERRPHYTALRPQSLPKFARGSLFAPVSPDSLGSVGGMSTRARVNSAGGGTNLIFLALAALWPDCAGAENRAASSAPACRPAAFASGIAARVTDGRTLVLDDGRTVRLAGIESPAIEAAAGEATTFLQGVLAGKSVVLKGSSQRDRHGRLIAHAFLGGTEPERWIQGELVAAGHARVIANSGGDCAAELMRQERDARKAGLGLWSDPYYAVRPAEDPAALA